MPNSDVPIDPDKLIFCEPGEEPPPVMVVMQNGIKITYDEFRRLSQSGELDEWYDNIKDGVTDD